MTKLSNREVSYFAQLHRMISRGGGAYTWSVSLKAVQSALHYLVQTVPVTGVGRD